MRFCPRIVSRFCCSAPTDCHYEPCLEQRTDGPFTNRRCFRLHLRTGVVSGSIYEPALFPVPILKHEPQYRNREPGVDLRWGKRKETQGVRPESLSLLQFGCRLVLSSSSVLSRRCGLCIALFRESGCKRLLRVLVKKGTSVLVIPRFAAFSAIGYGTTLLQIIGRSG